MTPFNYIIHPRILQEFGSLFIPPFTAMISKSLKECVFLSKLKSAMVIPIFTKDDTTKCPNYQLISFLSKISNKCNLHKKFSTEHAILSIVEQIKSNMDNKTFSCGHLLT